MENEVGNWIDIRIEEPPKGNKILIKEMWSNEIHTAFWHPEENCAGQFKEYGCGFKWAFSHWMPLPKPPQDELTHHVDKSAETSKGE